MINVRVIPGAQSKEERQVSFKHRSLVSMLDNAYHVCFVDQQLTRDKKESFNFEYDLPEFAKYLEVVFPGLTKIKFNNVVPFEKIEKISEFADPREYYSYLEEKGYISRGHHLVEEQFYIDKREMYFDRILPQSFLKNSKDDKVHKAVLKDLFSVFEDFSEESYYRYKHTLNVVKSLMAVRHKDYDLFVRLSDIAVARGETMLSPDQFEKICDIFDDFLEKATRFDESSNEKKITRERVVSLLLGLAVTHDYGVESPGDDAGHHLRSAKLCRPDFERLGFTSEEISFVSLVNGNHCYFGDVSLGEGTLFYYIKMLKDLSQLVADDFYLKKSFITVLWLLNILDINASHGGFLSKEKMDVIGHLNNIESFEKTISNENILKYKIDRVNENYPGRTIDYEKIDANFSYTYPQHFIGFFKNADKKTGVAHLKEDDAVLLLNRVSELASITKDLSYRFIAFKYRGELSAKVINHMVKNLKKGKIEIFDKKRGLGFFCGFPFSIEDDYLIIDNEVSYGVK